MKFLVLRTVQRPVKFLQCAKNVRLLGLVQTVEVVLKDGTLKQANVFLAV